MLRRIYDWCIAAAHKPYALWILGLVSFAESSFFPVPPDVMLIPMSLARPQRAWLYAAVCTVTSVLGGVLGYAIGALLYVWPMSSAGSACMAYNPPLSRNANMPRAFRATPPGRAQAAIGLATVDDGRIDQTVF